MFDEQFKKYEKAVKTADSSVSIESKSTGSIGQTLMHEALKREKSNSSFFLELVELIKEKDAELKEKEEMSYGQR